MKRSAIYRHLSLWAAVLGLLALTTCVRVPPKKLVPCRLTAETCGRVLNDLARNYRTLSGYAKIRVETKRGALSFSGDLYARSPDKLHFDIFGFLHRPRFWLIKSGNLIAWRDFDSGRRYAGPLEACPAFPVKFPLSPTFLRDFIRILFLNFPPPVRIAPPRHPEGPCRFLLICGWGAFDMESHAALGLPRRIMGPIESRSSFRLTYSDYGESGIGPVPHRLTIVTGEVKMTLDFKTLKVNPKIPANYFMPLPGS